MPQRRRVMVDLVEVGRLGGIARAAKLKASQRSAIASKGGVATAASRTPEQRSEAMRHAVNARWKRYRAAKRAALKAKVAA